MVSVSLCESHIQLAVLWNISDPSFPVPTQWVISSSISLVPMVSTQGGGMSGRCTHMHDMYSTAIIILYG